jgi:flagellar biosynthesis/type III secretory pathway chaperone
MQSSMTQQVDLDRLVAARERCDRLRRMLEDEFVALRGQAIDRFEQLQIPKSQLLAELSEVVAAHHALVARGEALSPQWLSAWDHFRIAMLECRDLHRRNELLIIRKREAIQGALSTIVGHGDGTGSTVTLYDRLGKMARPGRRNAYAQA